MVFEVTAPKSNALQLTDGEGREAGSFVGQATRRSIAVLITGGVLVLTSSFLWSSCSPSISSANGLEGVGTAHQNDYADTTR